ncbi:MAG: hypothetical protein JRI47_09705 [Deltaproteobacteria bacterium]|nr:hypothetical protein [Deltaproteobacteria bacterium]
MRLSEQEILDRLKMDEGVYDPLVISRVDEGVMLGERMRADAVAELAAFDMPPFRALLEVKAIGTPKAVLSACRSLKDMLRVSTGDLLPLLVAPYIGTKQAAILAGEGISWIDLSGNMNLRVPGRIYIERTGRRNKFPDTAPIKKVFQGKSSLVSRALLLKPEGFSSLSEVVDFIKSRNVSVTVATVSKVIKVLEDELLVRKRSGTISVDRRDRLLERLAKGYSNDTRRKYQSSWKLDVDDAASVSRVLIERQVRYAACSFYAAQLKGLGVAEGQTLFVESLNKAKDALRSVSADFVLDSEFGQLTLVEPSNPFVWFNMQESPNGNIVDDIELYLEMTVTTPRGPKIAQHLAQRILATS